MKEDCLDFQCSYCKEISNCQEAFERHKFNAHGVMDDDSSKINAPECPTMDRGNCNLLFQIVAYQSDALPKKCWIK